MFEYKISKWGTGNCHYLETTPNGHKFNLSKGLKNDKELTQQANPNQGFEQTLNSQQIDFKANQTHGPFKIGHFDPGLVP